VLTIRSYRPSGASEAILEPNYGYSGGAMAVIGAHAARDNNVLYASTPSASRSDHGSAQHRVADAATEVGTCLGLRCPSHSVRLQTAVLAITGCTPWPVAPTELVAGQRGHPAGGLEPAHDLKGVLHDDAHCRGNPTVVALRSPWPGTTAVTTGLPAAMNRLPRGRTGRASDR
jgi:hypothetical protein